MRENRETKTAGFTLLEVIAGMGIAILIIGGVVSIAVGSMDLSVRSSQIRLSEIRYTQLGQVFRSAFDQLPAQREIRVLPDSSLLIAGVNNVLRWPGVPPGSDAVMIRLNKGRLEVVHFLGNAEIATLSLMEGVEGMAWQVFDPELQEWVGNWVDTRTRAASLIRIRFSTSPGQFREEVFYIPLLKDSVFQPPKKINDNADTGQ